MSAFTDPLRRCARLLPLVGALGLMACTTDDGTTTTLRAVSNKVATDSPAVSNGNGMMGSIGDSATPSASPAAAPHAQPTLQALLIVPSSVNLSSDPSAAPGSNGANLTVLAQLSDGRQIPTSVAWTTSPSGLVTVNAQNYASVALGSPAGTVTLTASSGSVHATVTANVSARALTVNSVSLAPLSVSLYVPASDGNNTAGLPTRAQLTATVTMSDGSTTSAVSWSSSAPSVATVGVGGLVMAQGSGTATLTATSLQDPGKSVSCQATIRAQGLVDVTLE